MFCPQCATQNVEGASFCRSCGANISQVPQAMTGKFAAVQPGGDVERAFRRIGRRAPSLDNAARHLMMGVAFVVISILVGKYSPGGWTWWYWLLIPASTLLARGISDLIRVRQSKLTDQATMPPQVSAGTQPVNFASLRTGELRSPVPSVTEGTTRHLGAEAATRHFDPVSGEEKFS